MNFHGECFVRHAALARRLALGTAFVLLGGGALRFPAPACAASVADSSAAPGAVATAGPDSGRITAPASIDSSAAPTPVGVAPAVADPQNARLMVATRRVRLIGPSNNVVRSGPGNGYALLGVVPTGATFVVIAKSGPWYGIRFSDTETGWVHSSLCRELDDLSGLQFSPNPRRYTRTGSYVLSGYAGAYAFDRKSNSLVLGGRLGYYLFDRFQAEAGVSWTHVRRAQEIVESLFDLSLEAENFHMLFYQFDLMWELLPGRQMVPFVSGGVGTSIMLGRAEPSINFGGGTKLFLSKRTAMRWDVRDYRFESGSDHARLKNNNIEFTLGTEYLF